MSIGRFSSGPYTEEWHSEDTEPSQTDVTASLLAAAIPLGFDCMTLEDGRHYVDLQLLCSSQFSMHGTHLSSTNSDLHSIVTGS